MSEVKKYLLVRAKAYGFYLVIEKPIVDKSYLSIWDVFSEHETKEEAIFELVKINKK